MALYKFDDRIRKSTHKAFDDLHQPGDIAPYSGIYQCENCSRENACNHGDPLPPQNHAQHSSSKKIVWRLIVGTEDHSK